MKNASSMKRQRAVAYYRSASNDGESLSLQKAEVEEFCARHRIEIVHSESDEGVSGRAAVRPGLSRLMSEWVANPESPRFEFLVMRDPQRMARTLDVLLRYRRLCKKHGVGILFVVHYAK